MTAQCALFVLFSASGLKDEKLIKKSKPTQKLKHTNSILEYFEYFCQMLSKWILIIFSYTVSKLTRFLRHSVESLTYILPLIICVYFHSYFSGGLRKTFFSAKVRFGRSRSSKVIDFGTNRKCIKIMQLPIRP